MTTSTNSSGCSRRDYLNRNPFWSSLTKRVYNTLSNQISAILLQWDVSGALSCAYPRISMAYLTAGRSHFAQNMPNHLREDFDSLELLAGMDCDCKVDHFWENDHVSAVCPDDDLFTSPLRLASGPELHQELLLSWRESSLQRPSPA
jgi:hypothetical protein